MTVFLSLELEKISSKPNTGEVNTIFGFRPVISISIRSTVIPCSSLRLTFRKTDSLGASQKRNWAMS